MATKSGFGDPGTLAGAGPASVGARRAHARGPSAPVFTEFQAEYAIGELVQRVITFCFLTAIFALFAYFLGTGFWLGVAGILIGLMVCLALLYDYRLMTIGWLFSIPTVCVIVNNKIKIIPVVTSDRLYFASLFGVFILGLIFGKGQRRPLLGIEKAILAFLAVCFVSMIWRALDRPPQSLFKDVALFLPGLFVPMMSFFLARSHRWDERGIRQLMIALLACGAVIAMFGYLQYFLKMTFFIPNYMEVSRIDELAGGGEQRRTTGPFANAVEFGCVLGIFVMIAIFMFARTRDAVLRTGLLGLMGFMFVAMIIGRARAAWLGTLVALAPVFFFDRKARPFLMVMAVIGAIVMVVAMPFFIQTSAFRNLSERAMEWSPIYNRIALAATAINMFIHNPVFGLGFGRSTFTENKMEYIASFGPVSPEFAGPSIPHNEFLHILLLTGVVGFVPYLLILINCAKLLRQASRVTSEEAWFAREFWPYLAGIFLMLLINASAADVMWFSYLTTLHFFLFGVLATSVLEDRVAAAPARADPAPTPPPSALPPPEPLLPSLPRGGPRGALPPR